MEDLVHIYLSRCRVLFRHSRDPHEAALAWLLEARERWHRHRENASTDASLISLMREAVRHHNAINAAIDCITFEMMLRDLPTRQPTKGAG